MPEQTGTIPQTTTLPPQNEAVETFDREYVQSLRAEGKSKRLEIDNLKKQLDKYKGIESLLGSEETPETLKQKLSDLQNTNQSLQTKYVQTRIETVITRASAKNSTDPELTLAYMQSKGLLKDLDVESSTFESDIEKLVAKVVKDKPSLSMQPIPQIGDIPGNPSLDTGKFSEDDFMNRQIRKKAGY